MFGIDVSAYQGAIRWDLVKPQIDFAILRLGWIGRPGSRSLDDQFERSYRECKRLGIPIGVYVYCYSAEPSAASAGAEWALSVLSGKTLELPVFIDMEEARIAHLGRQTLTQIAVAFCNVIQNGGFTPGVYANLNWYNNYLNKDLLKSRYFTWIAVYSKGTDRFKGEYDMWQNSDSGRINGISGPVDTDYLYSGFTGGSKPQPEPQPAPQPNPQPAPQPAPQPDPYADSRPAPQPEPQTDPYADPKPERPKTYIVQPGDTLSGIAARFHTTVKALAEKNNIKNPDYIQAGQKLIL